MRRRGRQTGGPREPLDFRNLRRAFAFTRPYRGYFVAGMLATVIAIEVLVVAAVKTSKTFDLIFYGVGVYDVHDYGDAH